jgi:CubicO group peptidase (beta-lactamase class C family)
MRKIGLAAMAVALAACGVEGGSPEPGAGPPPAASYRCDGTTDATLRAWAAEGFSGSVAIATRGEFTCLAAYGRADEATGTPNTVDTVFSIGSVTKAFTAAAALRLVDEGALSLDTRVRSIVPEITSTVGDATVLQLMQHVSGLNGSHSDGDYEPFGREEAIAAIAAMEPVSAPGASYLYSNAGYTLLALIVEEASGTGFRDYLASHVLRLPDGDVAGGFWNGEPRAPEPRAVGYHDDGSPGQRGDFLGPHWGIEGNGGLAMSTRELASWTHALFTGRIVAPASVDLVSGPGHDLGEGRSETPGWGRHDGAGTPVIATAGGGGDDGQNAVVAWLPEREQVVAMASNRPELSAEQVLQQLLPAMIAGDPLPAPERGTGDSGPADPAVAGTYRLDGGDVFEVRTDGDRLVLSASGADAVAALLPPRPGTSDHELRAHEERVLALLAGRGQEGRAERAAIESELGPVSRISLAGTVVGDDELRTYVTVDAGGRSVLGWYAVNAAGGIEGSQLPSDPPSLRFVPAGEGRYRPHDPTGTGPDVTVRFDGAQLVVDGAGGTATATRAAG